MCVNILSDLEVFAFTHTQGFQNSRLCQEFGDHSVGAFKKLKDTQAGVLVLAGNPRKKQSVDMELSRGCGSKFPTRGSNKMLVVYVAIV